MRKHGEIGGVYFRMQRFSIYSLGYEYRLFYGGDSSLVSVRNMKELKQEIAKLAGGFIDEQQDQIQVQPMQRNS
jgi:hypothetical protein